MDISFSSFFPGKPGALVVGIAEGGVLTPAAARLDRESDGAISQAVSQVHFSGKAKSFAELVAPKELKSSRIILAGIGKPEGLDAHGAEELGAAIVKRLLTSEESTVSIAIDLPPVSAKQGSKSRGGKKANVSVEVGVSGAELAAHIALGAFLQSYRFDHYRTKQENERPLLKKVNVVTRAGARASKLWSELSAVAQGTMLARDLVNEPPNILHPTEFAKRAKALTKLGVKVEILSEVQMKKLWGRAVCSQASLW
jgi:leucyl aminopeptidase